MKQANPTKRSAKDLKELYGKEYADKFSKSQSPHRLFRLIQYMHLTPDFHVADFACGNGMLLPYVASRVSSYTGVDFSEDFIKDANERKSKLGITNASFYCDDINNFCDNHLNAFDCAFAMDFSEHVYDSDWLMILKSIRKTLKPKGSLYLHTPNSRFFIEQMKARSFILSPFDEHVAVRSPEENVKLLMDAGYKIEKILYLPHYNILKFVHFFSYIPAIGEYFKARIFIQAIA